MRARSAVLVAVMALVSSLVWSEDEHSETPTLKVWARTGVDLAPWLRGQPHHDLLVDDSGSLHRIERSLWNALPRSLRDQLIVQADRVTLPTRTFDTYHESLPPQSTLDETPRIWLVQPYGGLAPRWRARLLSSFAASEVSQGALLLIDQVNDARDLSALVFRPDLFAQPNASAPPHSLQYAAPLHPLLKVDARLNEGGAERAAIYALRSPNRARIAEDIEVLAQSAPSEYAWRTTIEWRVPLEGAAAITLAQQPELLWILLDDGTRPCSTRSQSVHTVREWILSQGDVVQPSEFDTSDPGVSLIYSGDRYRALRVDRAVLDRTIRHPYNGHSELVSDLIGPPCWFPSNWSGFHPGAGEVPPPSSPLPSLSGGSIEYVLYLTDRWTTPPDWAHRIEQLGARAITSEFRGRQFVWAHEEARQALAALVAPPGSFAEPNASDPPRFLRATGPLTTQLKLSPALAADASVSGEYHFARLRVFRTQELSFTQNLIESLSPAPIQIRGTLELKQLRAWLDMSGMNILVERPDVFSIEPQAGGTTASSVLSDTWLVLSPIGLLDRTAPGVQWLGTFRGSSIVRLTEEAMARLPLASRTQLRLLSDVVTPNGFVQFDGYDEVPFIPPGQELVPSGGVDLYWFMAQPPGVSPTDDLWRADVESTGARVVTRPASWHTLHLPGILAVPPAALPRLEALLAPRNDTDARESLAYPLHSLGPLHTWFRAPTWFFQPDQDPYEGRADTRHLHIRVARPFLSDAAFVARLDELVARYLDVFWEDDRGEELVIDGDARDDEWRVAVDLLIREPGVFWAGDVVVVAGGPSGGGGPGDEGGAPGFDPNGSLTAIPALNPWTLILLAGLLLSFATRALRKTR